jgi:hypothetical protein
VPEKAFIPAGWREFYSKWQKLTPDGWTPRPVFFAKSGENWIGPGRWGRPRSAFSIKFDEKSIKP